MFRNFWLSAALGLGLAITSYDLAGAVPVNPHPLSAVPSVSDVQLARAGGRGGHRGGGHRGGGMGHRGMGHRGGGMAHRGMGHRGVGVGHRGYGVAHRGAHGRYRVGGRYHGGVWYGRGRHFWRGRWYAYGVGACWRSTPIGYVWTCL